MTNGEPGKSDPDLDPDATLDPDMTIGPNTEDAAKKAGRIDPHKTIDIDQTIGPSGRPSDSASDTNETVFGSSIGGDSRPAVADRNIQIEGYEILDELGRGGMGVVYKARDVSLNRIVALKMILAGVHASDESLARFKIEAEAVAQLKHRGIVQVYDVGQSDGQPYCALEFIEGGGLDELMNQQELSTGESVSIVEELAHAMASAHQAGIVHRDLKPANVLIAKGGQSTITVNAESLGEYRPKITDFGLAKKVEQESQQTRTGTIMGTPSYMAPEQARGAKRLGPAADIYSLGAILYHMVVGNPPFVAETPLKTIMKVLNDPPPSPRSANAQIDRDLDTIILKCLEKEPVARYASAEHLAQDLYRYQMGMPIEARPVSGFERAIKWVRRKPWAAAMIALTILGLVGVLIGGAIFNRQLSTAYKQVDAEHEIAKTALAEKSRALDAESEARKAETAALAKTDAALNRARNSEAESRRRLIDNYVNNGLQALIDQDSLRAMPWLSEAIALEQDPQRSKIHQLRFHMALQTAPKPDRTWLYEASVDGCHLSNDGKLLLSYTGDRSIEIRDIAKNEVIHQIESPSQIIGMAASGDFSRIIVATVFVDAATGNFDNSNFDHQLWQPNDNLLSKPFRKRQIGRPKFPPTVNAEKGWLLNRNEEKSTLEVVDLSNLEVVHSFEVESPGQNRVRFSEDGQYFAWIDRGQLKVVDLQQENESVLEVSLETESEDQYVNIQFAPGDRLMLLDNKARLFQLSDGTSLEFPKRLKPTVPSVAVGPGDSGTAFAWPDGTLELFSSTAVPIDRRILNTQVKSLFYSHGGEYLYLASSFDVVKLASESGSQIGSPIPSTVKPLKQVDLSKDDRFLVIAAGSGIFDGNGCLRIWDVKSDSQNTSLLQGKKIYRFSPTTDGKRVGLISSDRTTLQIVDIQNRRRQTVLHSLKDANGDSKIRGFFWSPSGELFAVVFENGWVRTYSTKSGQMKSESKLAGPRFAVFSPDDQHIAVAFGDGLKMVQVIEVVTGKVIQLGLKHRNNVMEMTFSKDGSILHTISRDLNFRGFSIETGKRVEKSNLKMIPVDGDFDPAKNLVVVGGVRLGNKPGRFIVKNTENGKTIGKPIDFDAEIAHVALSRDGKVAALADDNGVVRLINVAEQRDLGLVLVHPDEVNHLQFSADGRVLLTVCDDHRVRLFDVASGVLLAAPIGNETGTDSAIYGATFLGPSLDIMIRTRSASIWQNRIRSYSKDHAATLSRFLSGSVVSERGTIIPSPQGSLRDDFSDVTIRQVMEPGFIRLIPGN